MKQVFRMIVIGGVALVLAGCGAASNSDQASTMETVAVPTVQANSGVQTGGLRAKPNGATPGVMGQIAAVDGSTITVEGQQQTSTVMNISGDTQIFKQATVDASTVAAGTTITAIGTQNGDTLTAMRVQIGGQAPTASGARGNRVVVAGKVGQVSGDTMTVKLADNSTMQIKLAANAQITERVQGTTADLAVGARVLARGEQSGAAVNATEIDILSAATASS